MKILLVSPGFPPDGTGGIENYVNGIFKEMDRRGHAVKVLTQYHHKQLENPNIHQVSTPAGEASSYAQWALKGWVRAGLSNADVIHFNGFPGQILALTPLPGVPKIVHVHNSLSVEDGYFSKEVRRRKLGHMMATRAYEKATLLIAPTLVVKDDLLAHISKIEADRVRVIPNCIDTEFYKPDGMGKEIREKYSLQDKFVILYFGKVKRTKGVETLCKAFQILKEKIDAALIIGGAPTATDWFLQYLKNTYKDVIFTGFVSDPRKYFAAADVFSIYTPGFDGGETFAISLAEAMSMGLPIVCSDNPIFREVTGGNALFGKAESAESLAQCLLSLARDPTLSAEMGRRSRRLAQSQYDSRVVADKVEEAYREVLR